MSIDYNFPKEWTLKSISDVTEKSQYGFTTRALDKGNIKFLRTTDITKGPINWSLVPYCEDEPDQLDKYLLKDGDVVISRAGSIGISALLQSPPSNAVFASYLIRFRPTINPKYFYYYLQSPFYWGLVDDSKSGIAVQNLNATKISAFPIPVPSETEQQRLVLKIEALFSEIDEGTKELQIAKQQLDLYKQSVLNAAIQGKLVPQEPNDEPAAKLIDRIRAEKDTLIKEKKIKKEKPLPPINPNEVPFELPKGWEWIRLNELVSSLGDGLHGTPVYTENGLYFFINGNNLVDGKIEIKANTKRVSKDEFEKHQKPLSDRTVLLSINGTIGNVAFYNNENVILGKSACYFNLLEPIDKNYIKLVLNSAYFLNHAHNTATGSTIKNVSLKTMRDFPVPLPPLNQQKEISKLSKSILDSVDDSIMNLREEANQSSLLKQAILKSAFEGKLL